MPTFFFLLYSVWYLHPRSHSYIMKLCTCSLAYMHQTSEGPARRHVPENSVRDTVVGTPVFLTSLFAQSVQWSDEERTRSLWNDLYQPSLYSLKVSSCGVTVSCFSSDLRRQHLFLLRYCLRHDDVKETAPKNVVGLNILYTHTHIYTYIYNKHSHTADKRWSSIFVVLWGIWRLISLQIKKFTNCYKGPKRDIPCRTK